MTHQVPIAILSALAEEQHGLIALLQAPHCVQRAGREFWCGALSGKPVVLALSRIGKVAAATTTATLIEAFGVGRVVFTGVAGGVGEGIALEDALGADVDPRAGRHLAVHHQALTLKLVKVLPGRPAPHEV